ncbi:MAG: dTMP kinase [Verrucomicrobiae bacterium]|nr:dTMP kinase [Verrucomicrobiae bacterium]MCX7722200.1 dTMP kinase [Verrucomicrobiae bacterium]MDW7981039.1 dTMP kinase [Verrucomicrobiales bacterium]
MKTATSPSTTARHHPPRTFYGHGLPGVNLDELVGTLIVIEGADGSGRSTQITRLVDWLESHGYATVRVGLKGSNLVGAELAKAQQGNILSRTTLALFYATDFADQLENTILPALRAGFVVLADRYIYTLMARDMVRGIDEEWLKNLYGIALVPDAVFYLNVAPEELVQRALFKNAALDYWESGMDIGLSRDMFDSFLKYQAKMQEAFRRLQRTYGFTVIDGNRPVEVINRELREKISAVLRGRVRPKPRWHRSR